MGEESSTSVKRHTANSGRGYKMDKVKLGIIGIIVILVLAVAGLAASPKESGSSPVSQAQTQIATTTTTTTTTTTSKTNQSSNPPLTGSALQVQVKTAQDIITRGSTQTIYVTVTSNGSTVEGVTISGTVTYASGSTHSFSGFTGIDGTYSYSWQISGNSNPGTFSISVTASKTGYTSGPSSAVFTVRILE